MLKIKKPGEAQLMDVGYDAVVEYKNYYEKKNAEYRVHAYNELLKVLDEKKAAGVCLDEKGFEDIVNEHIVRLRQEFHDVKNKLRKEQDPTVKEALKAQRKQLTKDIHFVGQFSQKHRAAKVALFMINI